ncbi:MAG: insulinase family protein [Gloeomargarita sp. SKYG116]|nr:insulinase family protein [Gloeomargarita sp. SKYG116]MCS7293546.1 insulinase family protein [Gloeomargarita sp. SKYB120]MDW8179112.1 pitrilysin family protein [Gloeomargarita sp. SKYBB_i_bin120]MDW8401210.1 pitrilysin family protein [Gloeomargarita sp. SKYGB_i_bin116]
MSLEVQPASSLQGRWFRWRLDNGLTLVVVDNPAADIVAARLFLRPGMLAELPHQWGLNHLLAATLTKGTQRRSAQDIALAVESLGASLGTEAAPDYFVLGLKAVTGDFPELFELASELWRLPTFPDPEVALERELTLQNLRLQQEQPFHLAYDQLRRTLYPHHPYSVSTLGTLESVRNLTPEDLRAYHQRYFCPAHTVVSICGRVEPERVRAWVERCFADWSAPAVDWQPPPVPTPEPPVAPLRTIRPTQQSLVMLGYPGPAVHSADYPAMKLLSTYLGNGLSSRLFVELREKQGLAYDVSAFYPTRWQPAPFGVYLGTAAANTRLALVKLAAEMQRLLAEPLPEAELLTARSKLLGQYALGKQTNAQIAQLLGWYEVLGLGADYDFLFPQLIRQLTPEHLWRAAQRYLRHPWVSLVGPATALADIG